MTEPLLRVRDLNVSYGASRALFGVSFGVEAGTVLAVLGVNGAGKSTLARAVSGLVDPPIASASWASPTFPRVVASSPVSR
jgi:branched-chain amino acid transport system ATP-binding protein